MIQLFITVGGNRVDYSRYVDWENLSATEKINIPSQMAFKMTPSDALFAVPPQRAYVEVYSQKNDRNLFTGYVSSEPIRKYISLSQYKVTDPLVPSDERFAGKRQLFEYSISCTSDEHLLNIKAVPFIPAFVNRTQGQILSALANILCPGFFDTSNVADGDVVPYFNYDPKNGLSEMAKTFGDGIRYRYKFRDKTFWYQPYGDQPLGITYDELQPERTFDPKTLDTSVLNVPLVNDVTIIGDVEAGNNHEDYFIGDGFTANFNLNHKVFRGASTMLLQETWKSTALNLQNWFLQDPRTNFDFSAGALNIVSASGTPNTLGTSYLSMNNGIEIAGGLDLEVGEVVFNDWSQGQLGGLYADTTFAPSGFLGGFVISTTGQVVYPHTQIIASGAIIPALGVGGVEIQPTWGGSGIGPAITSKVNNTYVMQMVITAPKYSRYTKLYRTLGGQQYGGIQQEVTGSVTFVIQEYDVIAATGFYYLPNIYTRSLDNVTLPSFAAYALVNNQALNITNNNTTLASMPLGGLTSLNGPSGLYTPTGTILPMLPAGSGGYIGPVLPWPAAASASIFPPPGQLATLPTDQVLGNGFELQAAQITAGNEADILAFYAQSIPAAGTPIRFQSWEAQAAVSRVQASGSIAQEAFVVGDDGIRSAIVTDLNPLPRTSEDCDNAALAYLQDRTGVFYNGSYTCTSLFFQGLNADQQFWPTCGRFLNVNAPRRGIVGQRYLVVGLTITILDAVSELLQFNIQFGADLYLEKVLKNFVDLQPSQVLAPTDKANPPNPRFTQNVTTTYLPDLSNVQVDMTTINDRSINVKVYDNYQGPIEIRLLDGNWGRGATFDYVGTFLGPTFTLPRQQFDQTWYMRPSQPGPSGNVISRRSKVLRVRYPLRPTQPAFVNSNKIQSVGPSGVLVSTLQLQLDFTGDIRSIYGFELRAADNKTVLVQKPVTNIGDLNVDLSQTPFLYLTGGLAGNYNLYAYFFNHQWVYSQALALDALLLQGTRDPYPWEPGWTGLYPGEAMATTDSFGVQPAFDSAGNTLLLIKGYQVVNQLSTSIGAPIITMYTAASGGSLPDGQYVLAVSAFDGAGSSFGETPLSNVVLATIPHNTFGGKIIADLTWESSFGGQLYAGVDVDHMHHEQDLGVNQSTVEIDYLQGTDFGPPDPIQDHFGVLFKTELHGGAFAAQCNAVSATSVTFSGAMFTPNQFKGALITMLAKFDQTAEIPYFNFVIASNTAATFTVGPSTVPDTAGQPPDLTTIIAVGDLLMVRLNPTFSANGFTDPNLINFYSPSGAINNEQGNLAWVIDGPGSPQIKLIASNTPTSYTLADNWDVVNGSAPTSGSIVIIVTPTWQPESETQPYQLQNVNTPPGVVAQPNMSSVTGTTIVVQVLTEDANGNHTDPLLAPLREVYLFPNTTGSTLIVSN